MKILITVLVLFSLLMGSANAQEFTSKELTIKSDGYELGATLDIPKADVIATVLIVPGSGQVDRNGPPVAATKKDLDNAKEETQNVKAYEAWGHELAESKVACLRYDKRALQIGMKEIFTFSQENQIDDLVAGIKLLKQQPEIDSTRIFLLGHSEGGNLVVEAALREKVAGVIISNGTAIAIDSLFMTQLELNANLSSKKLEKIQDKFNRLRDGSLPDKELLPGACKPYWGQWVDMFDNLDSTLSLLNCPVLVQLAESDENFPGETNAENIKRWKHFGRQKHITVVTYKGRGHSMDAKTEESDANNPIQDIVEWFVGG
ncbi:MAG: prolyl oligopeptidase family serine peptidase [Bacteroidetes bacterium]|nr:prolyl oligopeptidase family serine peptidase [Bacteroidota bacterium]